MKIQTFSIVVGTRACNAKCAFCVSRMTGFEELPKAGTINYRNLSKAVMLAKRAGTTTVLLTGKGEPTLYPNEITGYLTYIADEFPFIELQTNGIAMWKVLRPGATDLPTGLTYHTLRRWRDRGLNTIALSAVSLYPEDNRQVYSKEYPVISNLADELHEIGFSVRLCVMMANGTGVSDPDNLAHLLEYCRKAGIEQLTVRPVRKPANTANNEAYNWVETHCLTPQQIRAITDWVDAEGTKLLDLMHGTAVYDVGGQNLCLSDCLTTGGEDSDIRTLIFYGDGRISYDWQHRGAVLLGGSTREDGQ